MINTIIWITIYLSGVPIGYWAFKNALLPFTKYKGWTIADRRFAIFGAVVGSWICLWFFLVFKFIQLMNKNGDREASW